MEHSVKIVIGANYGDEGKGLMSRYFTKQYVEVGKKPVTVFHNGSAQRGHTADYEDGTRHVFHNFCAGAKDGGTTYYARTFLVHPMDFYREVTELGFIPKTLCDPECIVVTPWDMLADHIIEDYIAAKTGAREYGSCGYGTWSATDRIKERPDIAFTVLDYVFKDYRLIADTMRKWVLERLKAFKVDLDLVPQWKPHLNPEDPRYRNVYIHFYDDVDFFFKHVTLKYFDELWNECDSIIFEGAQGLLLDKDRDSIWTTTSSTGILNPYNMICNRKNFHAEACYVTRSYVTRHGDGPLDDEVSKEDLGDNLTDRTNVFNDFQGGLRYAELTKNAVISEICRDFNIAENGSFDLSIAITHCNEHDLYGGDYRSYSPEKVIHTAQTGVR